MSEEQQALQEMRNAIRSSPGGERVLERMDRNVDQFIKANTAQGDAGQVYLCLLAATIAVRMNGGTIK